MGTIVFNARPSNAGVLRPSVLAQLAPTVEEEDHATGELSPWMASDSLDAVEFKIEDETTHARPAVRTIVLAPPPGVADKEIEQEEPENYDEAGPVHEADDLFSRSGFTTTTAASALTASVSQGGPPPGPRRRAQ